MSFATFYKYPQSLLYIFFHDFKSLKRIWARKKKNAPCVDRQKKAPWHETSSPENVTRKRDREGEARRRLHRVINRNVYISKSFAWATQVILTWESLTSFICFLYLKPKIADQTYKIFVSRHSLSRQIVNTHLCQSLYHRAFDDSLSTCRASTYTHTHTL